MNVSVHAVRSLFVLCCIDAAGCTSLRTTSPVEHAMSAFVVFTPADIEPNTSLRGAPVDVITVRGGDIVRLSLRKPQVLDVGELASMSGRTTESWSRVAPKDGVVWLRPMAFTSAILVPRRSVASAAIGHSSDPGYYWFDLEARVLSWAEGPLAAPLPRIAPAQRIDFAAFAELDRSLVTAVDAASDRSAALAAARAIRKVVGLRTVRALRPVNGFPYFWNERPLAVGRDPQPDEAGRLTYDVDPAHPLELPMRGPALLNLFVEVPAANVEDSAIELGVFEGDRLRTRTGANVPRALATTTTTDPEATEAEARRSLRRMIVHVPPGEHVYRVLATARALVTPLRAEAVVHVEDASAKDEQNALVVARGACRAPASPALCALALELAGDNREDAEQRAGELTWRAAIAAAPEQVKVVSASLASGAPADPTLGLEVAASRGDAEAVATLSKWMRDSIDDGTRTAWIRALWRGTTWAAVVERTRNARDPQSPEVAPASVPERTRSQRDPQPVDTDGSNWMALVPAAPDAQACNESDATGWDEITTSEREFTASPWHRAPVLALAVAAECDDGRPIELAVDGQLVTANPSGKFVFWHVRVRDAVIRVRRLDTSRARVYALRASGELGDACAPRWISMRAPRSAEPGAAIAFGPDAGAPGLEIWLRDGAGTAELRLAQATSGHELRVVAARAPGTVAYDESGVRFTLVSRVALPAWAAAGVQVQTTTPGVAIRALVRVPRAPAGPARAEPPAPLADDALVALSRRILAASGVARGQLHLERALMLAEGGAERAALADARAADALGARGPTGERAVEHVRRAIRPNPPELEPLPEGVAAYGVEPDFDRATQRCVQSSNGPRAELARVLVQAEMANGVGYDSVFAARALVASARAPLDPRRSGLIWRALADSRWEPKRELRAPELRTSTLPRDEPVDGRGELRPRVALGARFDADTFATVSPDWPAEAVLAGLPPGTRLRVDLICAALEPALAVEARCPIDVQLGDEPTHRPVLQPDGVGSVALTLSGAREALSISIESSPARWVAHARLAFDRKAPGTVDVPGIGWVVVSKRVEHRAVLEAGKRLAIDLPAGAVYRIDARRDSAKLERARASHELRVEVGGHERVVPLDGSQLLLGAPTRSRIVLRSVRGTFTVGVAERVALEPGDAEYKQPAADTAHTNALPNAGSLVSLNALDPNDGSWLTTAEASPPPLSSFAADLGTGVAEAGVVYGTLREGSAPATEPDSFAFGIAGYRRRIESIGLWTELEGFARSRESAPSFGGSAALYEEIEPLQLRLSSAFGIAAQQIDAQLASRWFSRGFVEYSWRATSDFFLLPRLGYDVTHTSLERRPRNLDDVDDEVYNAYRARRPTFLYAQALLWYTPRFNAITYLRLRASYDPLGGHLSHVSARTGAFVAFGAFDVAAYLDSAWYSPADSARGRARFSPNLGVVTEYNFWSGFGSLGVRPGVSALSNIATGGYQVSVFVNVFASSRRGVRDFSSLELDFPEQLGGGIPWRGTDPGGYR